jgi:hypothetical protein
MATLRQYERLPQPLRVWLDDVGLPGLYVLVVPDPRKGEKFRDFFLSHDETGITVHMFSMDVLDDTDAVDLAFSNADEYAGAIIGCLD